MVIDPAAATAACTWQITQKTAHMLRHGHGPCISTYINAYKTMPVHAMPHQTTPNHAKPHHTIHMISGSHFSLFFTPPVQSLVFHTSTKTYDGIKSVLDVR